MPTNVKVIKLLNGESLISEVTNETDTTISVKNPLAIAFVPSRADPKTPTVGLAPWAEFGEEKDFTIHKAHVIVTMTPITEFVNQYNSIFGGIVKPSSGLILPEG